MRKVFLGIIASLLAGCHAQTNDLVTYIDQVKQNTPVVIEPYPEFETMPAFEYAAGNLRSPFMRPKNLVVEATQPQRANCLQPDMQRQRHPLEAYGMDALTMAGVFTSSGTQWVLIKANDGTLHRATIGDHLGLFYGRITAISNGRITITEMLPDGAGCWQTKQAELTMAAQAGENNNV